MSYKNGKVMNNKPKLTMPEIQYTDAIEAEVVVLGAVLMDSRAMALVRFLQPEAFVVTKHKKLYKAMQDLNEKGQPIDLVTIIDQLRLNGDLGVGADSESAEKVSPAYVAELTSRVGSTANTEFHARIIQQKFIRNKSMDFCAQTIKQIGDETNDPVEVVGNIASFAMQLHDAINQSKGQKTTASAIEDLAFKIEAGEQVINYRPTYTPAALHKTLQGWIDGELCIIGGRPGMGKTAFALDLLIRSAKNGVPCTFYSYEMPRDQILVRLISNLAEVSGSSIAQGKLIEPDRKVAALRARQLGTMPIEVVEGGGMDALDLRADILKKVHEKGVEIVVIDYLQFMPIVRSQSRKSTHDAIGYTVDVLKKVAVEAGICIIVLSQLAKDTDKNPLGRPEMKNLRDSGKIEDYADRVLFVWRPQRYSDFIEIDGQETTTEGKVCIFQGKFRHGDPGDDVWLRAKLAYSKFDDLQDVHERLYKEDDNGYTEAVVVEDTSSFGSSQGPDNYDIPF